ncbi:rRNA maturation RNase YbeY [Octadecabacter sp.]|nr:rRNA maturation RNase YbeY [Octadecabacter sp.]
MSATVDVLHEGGDWPQSFDISAAHAVSAALAGVGLNPSLFSVSILACDDGRIAQLNEDFRQKGTPTNVLSWPSDDRAAQIDGEMPAAPDLPMDAELGDIAISFDTCAREAAEAGKLFTDHVSHLIVHGTLHLLGFDHIRDADAALMEGLEVEILGKLDIPNPYS